MRKMALSMLLLCALAVSVASPGAAQEWEYDLTLYGWLAGLEGTIGLTNLLEEPVEASFSDLAGMVDFAMAGHFEARNPKAFFMLDVSYVGLGSDRDAQVANQPVTIDMDLDQWILELGGGYRVSSDFDLLLTGRYYILEMGATSESITGGNSGDLNTNWGDIYVGARYHHAFWTKWFFGIRGDIGAGGSDLAWFGNLALGYRFSEKFSAVLAYRILSLDREVDPNTANYFKYDITQAGLGIGVGYSF